ncbi:hypothetical protein NEOLI_005020 [Neolecta irregularis DAH-3]|uniref:Uncharacterized protein n=1 Tax=Neolecta irregularis (strain DAH-3) TaxID=1198029 RepID=A0A1U7LL10_NEOID|nr:hypothetical protein NEOLI_005020 [Neolecta irregularis DAH-3]|eukprot:OLL23337.1 hypothetical protein NEOLI_005020 [Neolecta irregularis DAH-3]
MSSFEQNSREPKAQKSVALSWGQISRDYESRRTLPNAHDGERTCLRLTKSTVGSTSSLMDGLSLQSPADKKREDNVSPFVTNDR